MAFTTETLLSLNTKYWLSFSSEDPAWPVVHHIKCDSRSQVLRKSVPVPVPVPVPVIVNICRHPSLDLQTSQLLLRTRHNKNNTINITALCLSFLLFTTISFSVLEYSFREYFNVVIISINLRKVVFIIIMGKKGKNKCFWLIRALYPSM